MDIVVLQHVFNKKIPFIRFFLKQELIYVPILGAAWWGLDFPFMKRHSPEYLRKHPEKRLEDLQTIRAACEKFRGSPVSVLNFLEGTRFSQAKKEKQKSPYEHLLVPKAGGAAFAIDAMGDQFECILDVTIYYPNGAVSLWEAFSGKLNKVVVRVRKLPVPEASVKGDFKSWLRETWGQKDGVIRELEMNESRSPS
jgi:1-acyl-sn-glycerol-3-phosphate acyltransferase